MKIKYNVKKFKWEALNRDNAKLGYKVKMSLETHFPEQGVRDEGKIIQLNTGHWDVKVKWETYKDPESGNDEYYYNYRDLLIKYND